MCYSITLRSSLSISKNRGPSFPSFSTINFSLSLRTSTTKPIMFLLLILTLSYNLIFDVVSPSKILLSVFICCNKPRRIAVLIYLPNGNNNIFLVNSLYPVTTGSCLSFHLGCEYGLDLSLFFIILLRCFFNVFVKGNRFIKEVTGRYVDYAVGNRLHKLMVMRCEKYCFGIFDKTVV